MVAGHGPALPERCGGCDPLLWWVRTPALVGANRWFARSPALVGANRWFARSPQPRRFQRAPSFNRRKIGANNGDCSDRGGFTASPFSSACQYDHGSALSPSS